MSLSEHGTVVRTSLWQTIPQFSSFHSLSCVNLTNQEKSFPSKSDQS